jgi:ribonucleoside-diphosphate reductase alpha chain|tara:strand:- start:366 stop:770 length:405 start_codon:yes stop_codon:yes gene_type:complete
MNVVQRKGGVQVRTDPDRDHLLSQFEKAVMADRYLLHGEAPQDLFARVPINSDDDSAHAQRLHDYISHLWLMPATPILSNGGTERGLTTSCFLNEAEDSLEGVLNGTEHTNFLEKRATEYQRAATQSSWEEAFD